jgi:lipoprotein Spr
MNLELLKLYALSLIGTPYFFGGDDPMSGFDCSGLVSEMLRAAGLVPYNFRTNAQGLFNEFKSKATPTLPALGAIAFFGKSVSEITHVAFCLDSFTMVEAGGGDSSTTTDAVASKQNAFVRLRPVKFRKDFLLTIMPNYTKSS